MGRPLAKRFFGNRNVGSASTTADNGIGGSSVASVTLGDLGAYTTRPTVTFSIPDLTGAGAVRATGTVTSEVESVTAVGGTQTGYTVGQLVTVDGTDAVLRVATIGGTGGDDALTFDFTGGSRGTFTTLPSGAQATTSNGAGAGLTVTLRFRAKAVVITEAGSGYTDATDAAPTFTQSVTGTTVLTADSSAVVGRQEPAIVAYAYVTGNNLIADIKKQVSGRRYQVTTSEGTAICKLVTDGVANAVGEMTITATDSTNATYLVSKLTRRRATLVRLTESDGGGSSPPATGWVYVTGSSAPWTFGPATGDVVSIANK
jgi:hypothetical protein